MAGFCDHGIPLTRTCDACGNNQPSAAEHALNDITRICGHEEWEYPGQVVRDVMFLRNQYVQARKVLQHLLDMLKAVEDKTAAWANIDGDNPGALYDLIRSDGHSLHSAMHNALEVNGKPIFEMPADLQELEKTMVV